MDDREKTDANAKVEKPATHFERPEEVAADRTLSPEQKAKALETLEQDARQLEIAAGEGMGGGEPNKLHETLKAKDEIKPTK